MVVFNKSVTLTKHFMKNLLLLMACYCVIFQVNSREIHYKNPSLLQQATLTDSTDSKALLNNAKFKAQLLKLAKQLPEAAIAEQSMFSKTALLSLLSQHQALITLINAHPNAIDYSHYRLHSQAILAANADTISAQNMTTILTASITDAIINRNDDQLVQLTLALNWSLSGALDYAHNIFKQYQSLKTLNEDQVVNLLTNSHLYNVLSQVLPVTQKVLSAEQDKRFDITPEILITTAEGVELAATIVKPKNRPAKLPTAMQFTIYADEVMHIKTAMHAAAHGYIGVVANSRGKRSSSNAIVPFELEGHDATAVINWISQQPWSDGQVVMYGGSYNGYTQWAATKYMPPALKAIAPYAAASLITGLPYENNIMLTANHEWAFHVTNNNTIDHSVYADWQARDNLVETLYTSGKSISAIDEIGGKHNPWFQKWLQHPSFDEYYQAMVPVKEEYKNINIPVLTVTGYFDGGQISAIDYLTRHVANNPSADHTLLIGPYNHFSAQSKARSHHSNYQLDEVALEKDTEEVVFQWFDYLLKNGDKPRLLKGKVNYQLMGSNQWVHKPSLAQMNKQAPAYYFSTTANEQGFYPLALQQEKSLESIQQTVDMADRTTEHNASPWPIISTQFAPENGIVLITEPFKQAMALAGQITGHFSIAVNKKDVDIGYQLYAIDKDGSAMHLNTYMSRASYAHDMGKRTLLTPNVKTQLPIVNARMTAKLFEKGTRLALVLNVNKNRNAQINMGTGKDVGIETIADAGDPLKLKWFNDSQINLPLQPWLTKK